MADDGRIERPQGLTPRFLQGFEVRSEASGPYNSETNTI